MNDRRQMPERPGDDIESVEALCARLDVADLDGLSDLVDNAMDIDTWVEMYEELGSVVLRAETCGLVVDFPCSIDCFWEGLADLDSAVRDSWERAESRDGMTKEERRQYRQMSVTVGEVEARILEVEGLRVRFVHPRSNRDVRGDLAGVPNYWFKSALPKSLRVADWRTRRFRRLYPDFDVTVISADGSPANGNTLLRNVGASRK